MDFNERAVPGISANYLIQESLARYEFVLQRINVNSKLLEVGFGTGYGSFELSMKSKVTGIDIDKEAVRYARGKYGNKVNFQLGNAERLTFPSGSFDYVVCFETIEHLKNPKRFLHDVSKVINKSGIIFLSTPNKPVHSPKKIESPYHEKEYTVQEFTKLLKPYFRKVELFGQNKSRLAKQALGDYMESQKKRQKLVDIDKLGIRKLVPRTAKEYLWRYIGGLFGRESQEILLIKDFPISNDNIEKAEYLIAICTNPKYQ